MEVATYTAISILFFLFAALACIQAGKWLDEEAYFLGGMMALLFGGVGFMLAFLAGRASL